MTNVRTTHAPRITLKPGKEKSLQRRHPWIFSGAIARTDGTPASGDTIEVRSSQGGFLGWAAYSADSQISARIWDFHESAHIDAEFFLQRIRAAAELRKFIVEPGPLAAVRLCNGESDALPGVVIDRFADWLVVQLSSAGAYRWRDEIVAAARAVTGIHNVYERSDADVLTLEKLEPRIGVLSGDNTKRSVAIMENEVRFDIDLESGHKTGFYLDQRDNRALLRDLAEDRDVLDCFCYTGGFTINALKGNATHVTAIDSSADAVEKAKHHVTLNTLPNERVDIMQGDVFATLRKFRDQGRQFDLIILDPPKFAPTAALAQRAARGYKDINLWAFKLLRSGGLLFTFSCSGGVNRDLFQKIVAGAAVDAGVNARVLHHLTAAADHSVVLNFPEGEYLKGLLCQID